MVNTWHTLFSWVLRAILWSEFHYYPGLSLSRWASRGTEWSGNLLRVAKLSSGQTRDVNLVLPQDGLRAASSQMINNESAWKAGTFWIVNFYESRRDWGPQAVVGGSASWGVAEEMVEEGWEVSPGWGRRRPWSFWWPQPWPSSHIPGSSLCILLALGPEAMPLTLIFKTGSR